ncbi:MAG: MerR family transcriptional regulator [Actinobacteria bacterium]|nr:MerR family transcriptional regulator [Actinomycetota bacterium]
MPIRRTPDDPRRAARGDGLYMISVAAALAGMHPQTLRIYEQRRLITPQRTPKGTRLYSDDNVHTLRRIQELTEEGMNLAGVERLFEVEALLARAQRRIASLERQLEQSRADALREIERVRRAHRRELVVYQPPRQEISRTRIPVRRPIPPQSAQDQES